MKKLLLILLCLPMIGFNQSIAWNTNVEAIRSFSSVRCADLNNDSIKDVVLGGGVDGYSTPYGVIAINGNDGNLLWTVPTRNEMFGSPQFIDINDDSINDIIISGRDAELRLINGENGSLIWEFWSHANYSIDDPAYIHPNDSGWYNFYNPQIINDLNGDGLSDLLCANGGDHSLDAIIFDRPPGHLLALDIATGNILYSAVVPDSNETYMSPLFVDLDQSGNEKIIFGTGGETISGNLWICDFSDLLNEDLSSAIPLLSNPSFGIIAPPSIGDLNNDLVKDIVVQSFDGNISAIDGSSLEIIWEVNLEGVESSVSPTLGLFSGHDNNLDVFCINYVGAESSYNDFYQILIDGENGEILFLDSIGDYNFSSSVAFDSNSDGKDEVLLSITNLNGGFNHDLMLLDFANDTTTLINNSEGGDIWSTPLVTDLDNNQFLDIVFVTQDENPFEDSGISVSRIGTDFSVPNQGISWGSYMGTNYNSELENYYGGCAEDLGLYLIPSISCPGDNTGSIDLFNPTGQEPFTYSWSNGSVTQDIDNLSLGEYTVIVADANGCQDTASVIIQEYTTTSSVVNPSCHGSSDGAAYFNSSGCNCNSSNCQFTWSLNDSIILQGNGSSPSQTHKWMYDIPAGTYISTIVHPDGCIIEGELILNDPDPLLIEATISNVSCLNNSDGSINLTVSGGVPEYVYLWDNGETSQSVDNLSIGNYQVIIKDDNACSDTVGITIEDTDMFSVDTITTCDSSISLTALDSDTYLWNTDETTQEIIVSESGYYFVETNSEYSENINNTYSMNFDGVDDYVDVQTSSSLDNISTELTVSVWINPVNLSNGSHPRIVDRAEGAGGVNDRWFLTWSPTGTVDFGIGSGANGCLGNSVTPLSSWTHIAATFNNGQIYIYINGILDASATSSIISLSHIQNCNLKIGSAPESSFFPGKIDDVSVWNIALSQPEIQDYMNCPPIGDEDGLVGYWNFEEGPEEGQILDLSANENHGTIIGAIYSDDVPEQYCLSSCSISDSVYVELGPCGCTDASAFNYDSLANIDDDSCIPFIYGCTDESACNYSSLFNTDDGSCEYLDGICETCEDGLIVDNDSDNDGICDADEVVGCIDELACNYNLEATEEAVAGDPEECIYVSDDLCETCVDGLIIYSDQDNDGICDAYEVAGCTDTLACNYNWDATDEDDSCEYIDGICDWCDTAMGTIIDNDSDDDGICDDDEIATYNCINAACIDPGDNTGTYTSLADCEVECTPLPSWNCVTGGCVDPADGSGFYSSLADCETDCHTSSINDDLANQFLIFPNPTNGIVNIVFNQISSLESIQLSIMNSLGELVYEEKVIVTKELTKEVDLSNQPKGVYFLEIITNKGIVKKKLILQ